MSEQQYFGTPKADQAAVPFSENINALGYFLDGWADLVEGMGEKDDEVRNSVLEGLKSKKMPDVYSRVVTGVASALGGENRIYLVNTTTPGATTAVYVARYGPDLYVSWRTFIEPVVNTKLLLIILGICTLLGLFTGATQTTGGGFFGGQVETRFSLLGWIGATLGFSLLAFGGLALAGRLFKGKFLAFFFMEPNIFDAEDITAMSFAVHKTILRSLDNSGIDVTKLRLKRDFKGGRRDEMV